MFSITNAKPENYQLSQGKKILNDVRKIKDDRKNIVVGLEKGSLQSHETNSQVTQNDKKNIKADVLNYGRILNNTFDKYYSASNEQGAKFYKLFDSLINNSDKLNSDNQSTYQKMSFEGLTNIEPLELSDQKFIPSDKKNSIMSLENQFNSVLSTYISTYKTMNEDIIANRNRLKPVNKYFGKVVTDDDKNFYYVNDYGYTHKYESDEWVKNDKSCPNNLTKITKNELDLLQNSVGMSSGQPCKIAGKNIQNSETKEVAWVDIKGVKHIYSETSWKGKETSCNVSPLQLSNKQYNMIPSGSNMTTTSVCDQLGVDPNIWLQLSELNEKLLTISKQLQDEMKKLRTQDSKIEKEIREKNKKITHYVKTLEKDKNKIKKHESMDSETLQGGYEDSVLKLRQKSYVYLAWSYVAVVFGVVLFRQMTKRV